MKNYYCKSCAEKCPCENHGYGFADWDKPVSTSDFGVEDITKIPPAKPGQGSKL